MGVDDDDYVSDAELALEACLLQLKLADRCFPTKERRFSVIFGASP